MNRKLSVEKMHLDPSLTLRTAHWDDLDAVARLTHDVAEMDGDASFVLTAEELANEWKSDGFNVERDVFVVETQDGRMVGSEELYIEKDHCKFQADGFVHPDFRGLGIGTSLLEKVTERAKTEMELAKPDARVVIQTLINNKDEAGHTLLQNEGYSPVRYFWHMEIKLQTVPPVVAFPLGIELRPFIKEEHAVAVWQADNEAFRDHWGSHEFSYDDWSHGKFGNPNFDPSLWVIAWDGDQIAGFSQNRFRQGIGWIGTIGVRRPWRKMGLGLALLQHSFGEFYKRDTKTIGLGVDAQNPTGATRLYQKAGMHAASEFVTYEKELRSGRQLKENESENEMTTLLHERLEDLLPEGFTTHGAELKDVDEALKLFNRWSRSVINEDEITDAVAIRTEWVSPGFNPAEDIKLIFAPDGEMVGYVEVWTTQKPPVHPWMWGRVDPRYENLGLGTYLLAWAEERAEKALGEIPMDLRFAPRVGTFQKADHAKKLFLDNGYQHIRSSYTMRINMDAPPIEPVLPDGITIRTYNPETDLEAVYRTVDEAFSDHFGHVDVPFEEGLRRFEHMMTSYEGFDPTLWFLAMNGDVIIGTSLCRLHAYDNPDVGWVGTLGVRRAWRKHGIGLALLRHSFGELYRRGQNMVGLGVDAQNLTGALRLYEGAGMHVHQAYEQFEKEIRPGKEISVQSL